MTDRARGADGIQARMGGSRPFSGVIPSCRSSERRNQAIDKMNARSGRPATSGATTATPQGEPSRAGPLQRFAGLTTPLARSVSVVPSGRYDAEPRPSGAISNADADLKAHQGRTAVISTTTSRPRNIAMKWRYPLTAQLVQTEPARMSSRPGVTARRAVS